MPGTRQGRPCVKFGIKDAAAGATYRTMP